MLKVYHSQGARSLRVLWLCEEMGVPYQTAEASFFKPSDELNIPVITALLTIIGYSINNNIVIFDRIRENLKRESKLSYSEVVNKSLNETFVRCLNTSFTVLLVLIPLYYFFRNEESLKYFTLVMGIGIFVGFFSSVFLSSPLLVAWNNYRQRKK